MNHLDEHLATIFNSAKIVIAQHIDYPGGIYGDRHRHDKLYQLNYLIKGECTVEIAGRKYFIKGGDLAFVSPGQWHASYQKYQSEGIELLELKFYLDSKINFNIPPVVSLHSCSDFLHSFHNLIDEFIMKHPYRNKFIKAYLLQHFLIIFHDLKVKRKKPSSHSVPESIKENKNKIGEVILTLDKTNKEVIYGNLRKSHTCQ